MEVLMYILSLIGLLFVGVILAIIFVCVSDAFKTKRLEKERKNQPCPYGERMNFWLTEIDKLNKERNN